MLFRQKKNKQGQHLEEALRNPKILEVNLIKEEVQVSFDWNKHISVMLVSLFFAGLFVAELYFGLAWWEKQEIVEAQALNDKIAETNREINLIRDQAREALAFKSRSAELSRLLASHIHWTSFFSWLEKNTLSSVKYEEFSGDISGKYKLEGRAPAYADVSWQAKTLSENPKVKSVSISQAESTMSDQDQAPQINFKLEIEISPDIFKP